MPIYFASRLGTINHLQRLQVVMFNQLVHWFPMPGLAIRVHCTVVYNCVGYMPRKVSLNTADHVRLLRCNSFSSPYPKITIATSSTDELCEDHSQIVSPDANLNKGMLLQQTTDVARTLDPTPTGSKAQWYCRQ